MNNPRHTPETRAGFTAGAVGLVANQAFFQALRTRNPAPLESLLTVVLDWAQRHLEHWPFQMENPSSPGEVPADVTGTAFAGLVCSDTRPVGADPAVKTVLEKILSPEFLSQGAARNKGLYDRWTDGERASSGEYPIGHPFAETAENFRRFVFGKDHK